MDGVLQDVALSACHDLRLVRVPDTNLISGWKLQDGSLGNIEHERNRYADEGPARVVITFPRLAWFRQVVGIQKSPSHA